MATRKRQSRTAKVRPRTRAPANWYRQTGRDAWRESLARAFIKEREADPDQRAVFLAEKRALRVRALTDNVKNLRQFFSGFGPADGYNLNDLTSWSAQRVRAAEQYATYLNHLLSQPYSRIAPRSKQQQAGLKNYTGQRLRRQRAYVVHKPTDDDEVAVGPAGEIVIVRELPTGGFLQSEYYYFDTILHWQPITWPDVITATREILPYLPEGDYFVVSELHGEIDTPHAKRMLLRLMQRYEAEYNNEKQQFADTIRGFKRVADEVDPDEDYQRLYFRRQKQKAQKSRDWNRLRKQVIREARKQAALEKQFKMRFAKPPTKPKPKPKKRKPRMMAAKRKK